MSNLVSTRRLWNNLHIVRLKSKYQRFHLHLAKTHNGDLVYLTKIRSLTYLFVYYMRYSHPTVCNIYYVLTYHTIIILPPYSLPPNVCNILCIDVSYNNYFTSVSFTTNILCIDVSYNNYFTSVFFTT